jgi:biuret amidohydrolase
MLIRGTATGRCRQALHDCGIRSVVIVMIAGVALEVGIRPTASHDADLGYIPVAVADARGYRDTADAQRALDLFALTGTTHTAESAALAQVWGALMH